MTQTTIDLGKIKFNWRGAYDPAVTYYKDDVVSYGGSSHILKVTSSTAVAPVYVNGIHPAWDLMAQGGDPSSIMTTQGDLLVRGTSGLERLAKGTNGQYLGVDTSGDLEWQTVTQKIVQIQHFEPHPGAWETNTSYRTVNGLSHPFTPVRSDTRIKLEYNYMIYWTGSHSILHMRYYDGDGNLHRSWTNGGQYQEDIVHFVHDLPSWGAGVTKTPYFQARDYTHNGNGCNFHGSYYNNGSGGNVNGGDTQAHPVIHFTEYLEG